MSEDLARVATVAVAALALTATALVGVAEAPSGVRVPAIPAPESPVHSDETVIVEPGDHFWKISAHRLADTNAPVGPYWRRVVEHNRDSIRSGDPDLIYPGEVVELPAP